MIFGDGDLSFITFKWVNKKKISNPQGNEITAEVYSNQM